MDNKKDLKMKKLDYKKMRTSLLNKEVVNAYCFKHKYYSSFDLQTIYIWLVDNGLNKNLIIDVFHSKLMRWAIETDTISPVLQFKNMYKNFSTEDYIQLINS